MILLTDYFSDVRVAIPSRFFRKLSHYAHHTQSDDLDDWISVKNDLSLWLSLPGAFIYDRFGSCGR